MSDRQDTLEIPWFLRQNPDQAKQEKIQEMAQSLTARVETFRPEEGFEERYLVMKIAGVPMRRIHIPDDVPIMALEAALAKLNA